jgi:hypothetical protein
MLAENYQMHRIGMLAVLALAMSSGSSAALADDADRIRPYAENPYYWQYGGKPVLLLGGSKDDNLFQIPDLKEHLDLLASVGGNYIRNTMSDRKDKGFEVYPFKRLPNGKYDLNRWNDEYWNRFKNLLKWTAQRDIIVQIEVWDRFDYTDHESFKTWKPNPYNPANNINYTSAESGLLVKYPKDHPSRDIQPFFHTIPAMDDNIVLRKCQQAFVDKMLSHSLRYGNVLYCMNNETSTSPKWGQFWMAYIRQKAADASLDVYVTDMFDVGWELDTEEKFLLSFDRPDIYTFLDISQNNGMQNSVQGHWNNIQFVRNRIAGHPRPINNTKIYGSDEFELSRYHQRVYQRRGTAAAENSFWLNIIGGCASARFHRPPAGIGLSKKTQANIRGMRLITDKMNIFTCEPRNDLLSDRKSNEAYCLANPGAEYAIYFPDGGEVTLDISAMTKPITIRWLDIMKSKWSGRKGIKGKSKITLTCPSQSYWAVLVR